MFASCELPSGDIEYREITTALSDGESSTDESIYLEESCVSYNEPSFQEESADISKPIIPDDSDFVRVIDYIPDIYQHLPYASSDNFFKTKIYGFNDAYLRYGTVKKLQKVQNELALEGLSLLIWDGYRPLSAQRYLWKICPDPKYVSNPETGGRSHCRGSAVDITLIDKKTGKELEMPSGFDEFSEKADRQYDDCTIQAGNNSKLLESVMLKYGFKPYNAEWWHFSDTEEYPVEEYFEPGETN